MRLVYLIALLLVPCVAQGNEVLQAAGILLQFTPYGWVGTLLLMASAVYGSEQAKKQAARLAQQQKDAYNNALQARTITQVATDAAYRYIYGVARVGSDVVAILTSGDRDEYKYIVCVHAAHECLSIDEIYINSHPLGPLDANGDVQGASSGFTWVDSNGVTQHGSYYSKSTLTSVGHGFMPGEEHTGPTFTLQHLPVDGTLRCVENAQTDFAKTVPYTIVGSAVTIASAINVTCYYDYYDVLPYVRVTKHLGVSGDPADAALVALFPDKWFSTALLSGMCYTVVRINLNLTEFQGGMPSIEALIHGKKLYDPRTGLTVWSNNPALAIRDYLTSEICGVLAADIPDSYFITAANVCDESITTDGTNYYARYTCNGTVDSSMDQQKVLNDLTQSMAGGLVATTWQCWAGKYVAPIMALSQSDIVGALSVVGGTPDSAIYNGCRARYIGPENNYVATDMPPYQNAAYLAGDGGPLWNDLTMPFTDSAQRIWNIARIFTEDQRNGFTMRASFSMKTWSLKVGNRVTFTSTMLGQTAKIYRVTDKKFGPDQAVELTLKEDAASIWDQADATTLTSTPRSGLPDPFTVGLCSNLRMSEAIYTTTGSVGVRSKATLMWNAPADATVIGYIFRYKNVTWGQWIESNYSLVTQCELVDMVPGYYDFQVAAKNIIGVVGPYTATKTFEIVGLTAPPEQVQNFSIRVFNGSALAKWDPTTSLDVKIGGWVEIRFCPLITGATWEQSAQIPNGVLTGDSTSATLPLATGTYFIKFRDSGLTYSQVATSFMVTETLITGFTTVATSTQHSAFTGAKTNLTVIGGALQLNDAVMWDSIAGTMDTWNGLLDYIGGFLSTGSYLFNSTLDLSTVASRRFHGHIASTIYNSAVVFDTRTGLLDSWDDWDGGAINDVSLALMIRTSLDNISYSPWTQFMVADYNCRYVQFRLDFASASSTHNVSVTELSVAVKTSP